MALASMVSSICFALFYLLVVRDSVELIWDRALVIVLSTYIYVQGFRQKLDSVSYIRNVYRLFYIHTTQVILSIALNNFDGYYFLAMFIITQACAYSFRDITNTFWYLLYVGFGLFGALIFISDVDARVVAIYSFVIPIVIILQYLASYVKCKFLSEMKMNQEMLRSLISKSEDAVFLTDMDGNISDFNPRATELFGYERHEILNHDFKMLRKHALTGSEIEVGLNELEKNKFWAMETTLVRKDLSEFPVRISITLIKYGSHKHLVYRVMDITASKENEAKIIEARDSAEEAVRAKGQFLAVMSHEIRTPLNGVIATASMLQHTPLNEEQEEYLNTITKSGQSLLMLINEILEFSKMENGKMVLDPRPSNIPDALFDVGDLLRSHAETKGIELLVHVDQKIPSQVMIDDHRLKQVMFNLVGNAIKFTSKGKVEISCKCLSFNQDMCSLAFEVTDTGIGIPEEKMHLLFKSFSQVDSSTSRKFGGTGLGLAISRQIVELMNGKFEVKSKMNEGTCFRFVLMARICEAEKRDSDQSLSELPVNADLSQLKVLVGEDNEINRMVLRFVLDSLGIQAVYANDGLEVIKACEARDYDIILMDMQMPNCDGLQATKEIRATMVHQPHIIAMTANTFDEDRDKCAEAGMNDFLAKPFEPEQLRYILLKWLAFSGKDLNSAA
ncbi:MAG: response regulator [Flavobacteriales bacterium]|nr:response regulator [Flavobacteriales bacterium]